MHCIYTAVENRARAALLIAPCLSGHEHWLGQRPLHGPGLFGGMEGLGGGFSA